MKHQTKKDLAQAGAWFVVVTVGPWIVKGLWFLVMVLYDYWMWVIML